MSSACRMGSVFASKPALLVLVLCAACSTKETDAPSGVAGAAGTSRAGAGAGPVAGIGAAGATTSTAGSSGSNGRVAGSGAAGVIAAAGSSGQNAPAGTSGQAGGGGAAGSSDATAGVGGGGGANASTPGCEVSPISAEMRSRYDNMDNDYYQKYASANEVVVATGENVSDEAVVRYCRLLTEMFSNEKIRQAILADKMWFTMIDEKEQLSSLPQISKTYGTSLNARARGLGGLTPTICAEDSIMCMPGDKWKGDCICAHETGHTMYSSGIAKVSELSKRLTAITSDVRSSGRLANAYVWQDGNESGMMSWGVQAWYDCAIDGSDGAYHSDINTRAELQKELPEFYQFLSELLPTDNEYEDCYANP